MSARSGDRGRRVARICERCDAPFMAIERHDSFGRGRFCSRRCSSANAVMTRNATRSQAGANNGNWKGGIAKHGYRYKLRFAAKSPEKVAVHRIVREAIRTGKLVRPATCSQCGIVCKAHAHHDDYTKPYDVRWLCQPCHNRHHAAERAARKQAA